MNWPRSLELVQVHCQGEIGKVIVGGAPEIPGATMLDKMNHINTVDGSLRRFVTHEPRACAQMSVNLLIAPTRPDADAGFIVLQSDRAHAMSGSNCMCVVTALLEAGRVPMREPETIVRLDTPAGLIIARAHCENGRCLSVSLDNVAAFAEELDKPIDTSRWGRIKIDIAFGGIYYAIIDVEQLGISIDPKNARTLAESGIALREVVAQQVEVRHPTLPSLTDIAYVMFRSIDPDGAIRTCTTLPPGRVDRSPCGTGSSANLAVLHARGAAKVGDTRRSRSIIGGEFTIELIGETRVGDRPAILPRITGSAWVYGREHLRMDEADPFPQGFILSDTWGPHVD
jgi:proline racemase